MAGGEAKKSDLGVRVLSAIVMVAVAGTALWLGGWVWTAFVAVVALVVLWEWVRLAFAFADGPASQAMWLLGGIVYIGFGASALTDAFDRDIDTLFILGILSVVVAVDVGAYFSGRTFGGPKIAPSISPSKTWSGLAGGVLAVFLLFLIGEYIFNSRGVEPQVVVPMGIGSLLIGIIAQAGDFFESWMKRRAGVKDSSNLIPGHGGLFDRVDGLLAVLFVVGVFAAYLALQPPAIQAPRVY